MPFCSKFTIFKQIFFENSERAAYSDLNPVDGGQSLYPMGTVFVCHSFLSEHTRTKVSFGLRFRFGTKKQAISPNAAKHSTTS